MAAIRISDEQKSELVERYRQGEATQALASAFGCSPNTVIRLVKGVLGEELYEQLKRQRTARGGAAPGFSASAASPLGAEQVALPLALDDSPGLLAIDDADDFVDDDGDEGLDEDSDTSGEDRDREANIFVTVPVGVALEDRPAATCLPLAVAPLPACLYMLVDKTVELQARPLSDFPELGRLSDGEQQRQALVVFANPRQAKRHCGRTQRVIKLPDSQVIHRTAPYLLGQGITRLVLEGAVYSLPGS